MGRFDGKVVGETQGVSPVMSGEPTETSVYDNFSAPGGYKLADYERKWQYYAGNLLDMAAGPDTRTFESDTFFIDDSPFPDREDWEFHGKYIALSREEFALPHRGSLSVSCDLKVEVTGASPGRVVRGTHGGPGSYPNGSPYERTVSKAEQAAAVLNLADLKTGLVLDWFVADDSAFPLYERIPSWFTHPDLSPDNKEWVGPDKTFTQMLDEVPIEPGQFHRYEIRVTRDSLGLRVNWLIDGQDMAEVRHVGIPLDHQERPFKGLFPSVGPGELLGDKVKSFVMGHAIFTFVDVFPYGWGWERGPPPVLTYPDRPEFLDFAYQSVSLPKEEMLHGLGLRAWYRRFTTATTR
jgi:hypothetical protein